MQQRCSCCAFAFPRCWLAVFDAFPSLTKLLQHCLSLPCTIAISPWHCCHGTAVNHRRLIGAPNPAGMIEVRDYRDSPPLSALPTSHLFVRAAVGHRNGRLHHHGGQRPLRPELWPGTRSKPPIRNIRCCFKPLIGVPHLRLGPCTAPRALASVVSGCRPPRYAPSACTHSRALPWIGCVLSILAPLRAGRVGHASPTSPPCRGRPVAQSTALGPGGVRVSNSSALRPPGLDAQGSSNDGTFMPGVAHYGYTEQVRD